MAGGFSSQGMYEEITMIRWEYLHDNPPVKPEKRIERMNELGRDGWELIAVDGAVCYFKRPVQVRPNGWSPQ